MSSALPIDYHFAQPGKLDDWQTEVAGHAYGNALAMFAIMGSFPGPIMRIAGLDSRGANLVGRTIIGKTSVLKTAVLVRWQQAWLLPHLARDT